jgi:hypothetical protein
MDRLSEEPEARVPANDDSGSAVGQIRYGRLWNAEKEEEKRPDEATVAVLVCHGMGQQVRYDTISSVAESIKSEAERLDGKVDPIAVHLSQEDEKFLARAEVSWRDQMGKSHCVHVYEAYWAPLTEGRVTYLDTILFLFSAAWNAVKFTAKHRGKFQRWMFGGRQKLSIAGWGLVLLAGVLAVLAGNIAVGLYVSLALLQVGKQFASVDLPVGRSILDGQAWQAWWHDQQVVRSFSHFGVALVVWAILILLAWAFRYFLIQFVGDVAAYISPYKDSKFDELRQKIQKVGLDVGKVVYGFDQHSGSQANYRHIVVVGHSLGSVLAYDTLNALINLDNVGIAIGDSPRYVVERTRGLITFGSPLDKTAFLFRAQAKNDQDWIREQMTNSVQPLIVDYELFRRPNSWVNLWSPMDIISGALDYYDAAGVEPSNPWHVQNLNDPDARIPLMAHVQYWSKPLLHRILYLYVTQDPPLHESIGELFQSSGKGKTEGRSSVRNPEPGAPPA